jgi:hypothetical protein
LAGLRSLDLAYWIRKSQNVEQLKSRDFDHLDLDNLIEEVESLGWSEKHAVSSYLSCWSFKPRWYKRCKDLPARVSEKPTCNLDA